MFAAIDQARITRAVGDIRSIELDIKTFELTEGRLPVDLIEIHADMFRDPWGNPYVYTNLTTTKGKGKARKDRYLNPLNSDFDLYSMGEDGASSTPLTAKASRDDIVRANDGAFVGLAADY
jgi:general secretion pathway protein G